MLFKLLRAIRFLGKQGLAFRGHNESSEAFQGNLYQLLQAEDCPKMVAYISPKIDIIQSVALDSIVDEVSSAQWYADEGPEMLVSNFLTVQWVTM